MPLDERHPANEGVLQFLSRKSGGGSATAAGAASVGAYATRTDVRDPYYGCGSHPDIVERVWDVIGGAVAGSEACIVYGTPSLLDGECGVVLAFCMGTQYVVRVPDAATEAKALQSAYKRT